MALTDIEKNFIYDYSVQLLQQDMLTNQLFGASKVGQDLRSLVLGESSNRAQTFTNPFEEAISGKLRTDADTTRQASRNVGEAAAMMGIAEESMSTINDALESMEEMLAEIEAGTLDGSNAVVQSDYDAFRDKITGIISSTDFNSIYLLDSSQWGTDQIDANGNVFIQSNNNGGFNIGFHAVDQGSNDYAWTDLDGSVLGGGAGVTAQKGIVDNLKSYMTSVEDMYKFKKENLESQETSLLSQAQIFDSAAQMRKPSDPNYSLEKLLADLIIRETGTIYDTDG